MTVVKTIYQLSSEGVVLGNWSLEVVGGNWSLEVVGVLIVVTMGLLLEMVGVLLDGAPPLGRSLKPVFDNNI
jgi:hypothetical protein